MTRPRAWVVLVALSALLAACGGGGNGGNGGNGGTDTGHLLHILVINASPDDVTIGYEGGGEPADDLVVATCTAETPDYPLADPFLVFVNGDTLVDSDIDLPDGLPNEGESDLILKIEIADDGTVVAVPGPGTGEVVRAGRGWVKPSTSSFCALPG